MPVPILYVMPRMRVGGTERHILEVLAHLDRRVFAPALYCLRVEGDLAPRVRELGVEIWDGRVPATLRGPGLITSVGRLARMLRAHRIQLVHAYLYHANFVAMLAARLARVPVALVSKRSLDTYPSSVERAVCRIANRLADRVVVNAEAVRRHVHAHEGCPLAKITVIPNGIDLGRVDRHQNGSGMADAPWPAGGPVLGTVGRLSAKKGHADLIDAAALVVRRVPGARFVVGGDGPLGPDLEERARALGLNGAVRFLGAVADGAREVHQLDIFVLPSHMEGMSNALLEAMAAGRPVVATDVGGNGEVVAHGATGLLVPPRDPARLADAIVTLATDPARARAMGAAGRARVAARFSVQTMVGRMETLYRDLLGAQVLARG